MIINAPLPTSRNQRPCAMDEAICRHSQRPFQRHHPLQRQKRATLIYRPPAERRAAWLRLTGRAVLPKNGADSLQKLLEENFLAAPPAISFGAPVHLPCLHRPDPDLAASACHIHPAARTTCGGVLT